MKRALILRPAAVAAVFVASWMVGFATSDAAQKSAKKARAPRLPNYVARVVNDEQRTEINAIQTEYGSKIQKLREELEMLLDERDAAIDKVLTPTQRKEVERMRDEAAAKRKAADNSSASNTKSKSKSKSEE
jgi:hypothetical protein